MKVLWRRERRASPNISFPHSPDGYETRLATFQRRRLFLPSIDVLQQSGLHSWRLFAAVEGVWSIRSSSISNSWSCSDTQTVHIEIVPILKWYQIMLLKIKNSDDSKWHFEYSLDVEGYHKILILPFSVISTRRRNTKGQWRWPFELKVVNGMLRLPRIGPPSMTTAIAIRISAME